MQTDTAKFGLYFVIYVWGNVIIWLKYAGCWLISFGQVFDTVIKEDIGVEALCVQNHWVLRCDEVVDLLKHPIDQFHTSQSKELIVECRLVIRLGRFSGALDRVVVHVKSTCLVELQTCGVLNLFTLVSVTKAVIPRKLSMNSFVHFSKSARSAIKEVLSCKFFFQSGWPF